MALCHCSFERKHTHTHTFAPLEIHFYRSPICSLSFTAIFSERARARNSLMHFDVFLNNEFSCALIAYDVCCVVLFWLWISPPKTTCFNMCRSTMCVCVCFSVNGVCKSFEHNMQCVYFSHVKDENKNNNNSSSSSSFAKHETKKRGVREKIRSLKDITGIHISSELFQFFRFNCTWAHQPHLSSGTTTTVNIKSIWLCQCQTKQIKWRTTPAAKPSSFPSLKILRARISECASSSFWVGGGWGAKQNIWSQMVFFIWCHFCWYLFVFNQHSEAYFEQCFTVHVN